MSAFCLCRELAPVKHQSLCTFFIMPSCSLVICIIIIMAHVVHLACLGMVRLPRIVRLAGKHQDDMAATHGATGLRAASTDQHAAGLHQCDAAASHRTAGLHAVAVKYYMQHGCMQVFVGSTNLTAGTHFMFTSDSDCKW